MCKHIYQKNVLCSVIILDNISWIIVKDHLLVAQDLATLTNKKNHAEAAKGLHE